MDIYIGADHGGFHLKQQLLPIIQELGHHPIDLGAPTLDPSDDYPDVVTNLQKEIKKLPEIGPDFRAILICSSGVGMCITANKIPQIRAILAPTPEIAFFARLHNDINVLCLGALKTNSESIDIITSGDYSNLISAGMSQVPLADAQRIVTTFLQTDTEATPGSRHDRRLQKICSFNK